jgi:hypothetical protein
MTKPEAKALMIEFWGYMAKHPECERKENVPPDLYDKIKNCFNLCPLCEVFVLNDGPGCTSCILFKAGAGCYSGESLYETWHRAPSGEAGNAIRAASAKSIAGISEAWNTEKELERLWGLFRAAMDKPIDQDEANRRGDFVPKRSPNVVKGYGFLCFLEGYEAAKREAKEGGDA